MNKTPGGYFVDVGGRFLQVFLGLLLLLGLIDLLDQGTHLGNLRLVVFSPFFILTNAFYS